jgi:hypothetical protein
VNDVADVEQPNSGDPVEGRQQFGVTELGFSIFDRCLIGFDNRLSLGDPRLLRGELLLGCIPLFRKRLIPAEIDPPIFEMGRVAGEIGLRLVELRLIGARIELGQELAFFEILPVLKIDADDRFRDHAADRRRVQRRDIADPGQHNREILFLHRGCDNGNGRRVRCDRSGMVRKMPPAQITPGSDRGY